MSTAHLQWIDLAGWFGFREVAPMVRYVLAYITHRHAFAPCAPAKPVPWHPVRKVQANQANSISNLEFL